MLRIPGPAARTKRLRGLAARYGGEEFAVILPDANTKSALVVAERIRLSMLESPQNFGGLTISIGVASRSPRADRDPSALVRDADAALYRAKANGRNRCETFMAAVPADPHALPVGI
jgi:diguanylate cyclase (GGDEF)-like protein